MPTPSPTLLRYADLPDAPWRNGGGTTREVLRRTGLRVSVATLDRAGAFSVFEGVDRTFVAAGSLALDVDGVEHLLRPGDVVTFPGEADVRARPLAGAVRAVNVMVPRGAPVDVAVRRAGRVTGPVVVVVDGAVRCGGAVVGPGDAVLDGALEVGDGGVVVVVDEEDGR